MKIIAIYILVITIFCNKENVITSMPPELGKINGYVNSS